MRDLHERYPLYGFDRHKGYVTDDHVRALAEHGPSPVHRYSFVNVTRVAGPTDLMGPAETLVASGISLAGAPGENERRVDS